MEVNQLVLVVLLNNNRPFGVGLYYMGDYRGVL